MDMAGVFICASAVASCNKAATMLSLVSRDDLYTSLSLAYSHSGMSTGAILGEQELQEVHGAHLCHLRQPPVYRPPQHRRLSQVLVRSARQDRQAQGETARLSSHLIQTKQTKI